MSKAGMIPAHKKQMSAMSIQNPRFTDRTSFVSCFVFRFRGNRLQFRCRQMKSPCFYLLITLCPFPCLSLFHYTNVRTRCHARAISPTVSAALSPVTQKRNLWVIITAPQVKKMFVFSSLLSVYHIFFKSQRVNMMLTKIENESRRTFVSDFLHLSFVYGTDAIAVFQKRSFYVLSSCILYAILQALLYASAKYCSYGIAA